MERERGGGKEWNEEEEGREKGRMGAGGVSKRSRGGVIRCWGGEVDKRVSGRRRSAFKEKTTKTPLWFYGYEKREGRSRYYGPRKRRGKKRERGQGESSVPAEEDESEDAYKKYETRIATEKRIIWKKGNITHLSRKTTKC